MEGMATASVSFKIHGLGCADEVAAVKRELSGIAGGEAILTFDILSARLDVKAALPVDAREIIGAIARTGMRAELWDAHVGDAAPTSLLSRYGRLVLTSASGLFLLLGFALHAWLSGDLSGALGAEGLGTGHDVPIPVGIAYGAAILFGAWQVLPKAWLSLCRLRPDMNLLMAIAVAGAILIGEWFEAATVAFLFAVSLALESWSVGRARQAIAKLMDLAAPSVRVRMPDGQEVELPPERVAIGTVFVVKPGERFALDGVVLSGSSDVNQAAITGESIAVTKRLGMSIFAGTVNGDGLLEVRSTKAANDSTLAHIIQMVGEAQSRRAPSEQWVERFAFYYTPVVIGLALLVALIPPLMWGEPWGVWFYRSLVLLVIGCPCALVISTPVSIVAGLTAAARHGVLVKGGIYLEAPAHLRAIALDKTGTLTMGKPSVTEVIPFNGHSERDLLERAGALESGSEHPLAQAVLDYARQMDVPIRAVQDFQNIKGKGCTGRLDGREFWLGSHRYLEERGQETAEVHARIEDLASSGRSVVAVGNETHVCGLIAVADSVRPGIPEIIADLHREGIEHVIMLTGDNHGTAQSVARATGIDRFRAELLPEDKVREVEELLRQYGHVAMVGDGVNDAPAMARSSIGIAMGAAGSDAAIETADVALMSDDLSRIPWLVRHSRRTLRIIRQNISVALLIKVAFVVLSVLGIASLWSAIIADMGASLLVTFNGLRLLHSVDRIGG